LQVERTLEILKTKYLKAYISYEGLQRIETFLFPMQGLREALLNAVIHKDYSSGVPIQLSVYEHQIVLWNSGQLPQDWSLEKLLGKHPSDPYNPLVASAFFRAGYVESWGRGIEKILSECEGHDIQAPTFDTSMSGLMVTFKANPKHLVAAVGEVIASQLLGGIRVAKIETTQETTQETTPTPAQNKILLLMKKRPAITRQQLAVALGITDDGVKYHLEKLKLAGMIVREGPTKKGIWKVLK
jgi:ATP-dependent DNA helicase RecG